MSSNRNRGSSKHNKVRGIPVRNKNVMLQLLESGAQFNNISIAQNLERDSLTNQIINLAQRKGISVETIQYKKMAKSRSGKTQEVIVGYLTPPRDWTLQELIDDLYKKGEKPLFIVANRVNFANNIGSIARTAVAAGVNGIFYQGEKSDFINEETIHFSTGAITRIPTVRMNIFQVLGELKKNGIRLFALDMKGNKYYDEKLTGSAAFVLGAEADGLSEAIMKECDTTLSIPMKGNIESLNVAVSTAIVLNERMRQLDK